MERRQVAWIYLITAGLFEVACTTLFRFVDGFTRLVPTFAFVLTGALSFYCLYKSLAGIPLGTAYAVWTGIGAAGTALIGIAYYQEPVTAIRISLLVILIGSIVGLKFVSDN